MSRTLLPLVGLIPLVAGSGCCGRDVPVWADPEPLVLVDGSGSLQLAPLLTDDRDSVTYELVDHDPEAVVASVEGSVLEVVAQPGWIDTTTVLVRAVDNCDQASVTEVFVDGRGVGPEAACSVELTWTSPSGAEAVSVAGVFNDWDSAADPMEQGTDGTWSIALDLQPGAYPYKIVELDPGLFTAGESWACDPLADFIQCDAGYKEPWDTSWTHDCALETNSCNSLLIVEPCDAPTLEVTSLQIDRSGSGVDLVVEATEGLGGAITSAEATLDGTALDGVWDGSAFHIQQTGLAPTRHSIRLSVTDEAGNASDEVVVPFWLDDFSWDDGVLYFAFVDRFADGDPSNNASEGATAASGGYAGGDLQGLRDLLPYLEDLGVSVLWLSNLQDNTEGAWEGDCDETYAGYHAYWPDDAYAVEEHFGDDALLKAVIDDAHGRGMRVIMDWVANHVHETHPYYVDHPEWFNGQEICKESAFGQSNWDRIPESCWFAPYLPDIDYGQPEPLVQMVDDALWWAETYELDGLRADAVKHMPHAVTYNLASAVRTRLEHTDAGGDERFYTVGETFDGAERIAAYLGEDQLDGQFDFPLYFAIRSALIDDSMSMPDLMAAQQASAASFAGSLMSPFLGNHDVARFITDAAELDMEVCDGSLRVAQVPTDARPYARIGLAWSFLFSMPGIPLIYYGDELGIPGYNDPDNRQPLWTHTGSMTGGAVTTVEQLAAQLDPNQAAVLRHVAALADARAEHPALRAADWVEWWQEPALYAYAKSAGSDHALVILNRSGSFRTLDNGLSFAGLPTSGTWRDVLTGDTFTAAGGRLTVDVAAQSSRVLVQP